MNSDVILMIFDGAETAQIVYRALQAMRKSPMLGLDDVVLVSKNSAGLGTAYLGSQASTSLARPLTDLLLHTHEGMSDFAGGVRLDVEFADTAASAIRASGSALLFYLDSESLSDSGELLGALGLFRGTIHQTTLPPQNGGFQGDSSRTWLQLQAEGLP